MSVADPSTLNVLVDIAREAGELVLRAYHTAYRVEYKSENDPVTTVDRAANELIRERLERAFPGVAIVAEESKPDDYGDYRNATDIFFVDPIDGTREFIAGTGEFVVMIGLCVGERATAGVVYSPTEREVWLGSAARGSTYRDARGQDTPMTVSDRECVEGSHFVSSRSAGSPTARTLSFLNVGKVQALGSAGLKGVRVASGDADAYLSLGPAGMRWDACAIDALIQGAGGVLTDTHGHLLDYRSRHLRNRHGLLGANPGLHASLVQGLARAAASGVATPAVS